MRIVFVRSLPSLEQLLKSSCQQSVELSVHVALALLRFPHGKLQRMQFRGWTKLSLTEELFESTNRAPRENDVRQDPVALEVLMWPARKK